AFQTKVVREAALVRRDGADVEIAVDEGEIAAGAETAPIHEIELELKQGAPSALATLVEDLSKAAPVRLGLRSKAERGYQLGQKPPLVAKAEPIVLDKDARAETGLRDIGVSCLRHLALNEDGVRAGNLESVHQMRIGLRRLRACLSLFKTLLGDAETDALKRE